MLDLKSYVSIVHMRNVVSGSSYDFIKVACLILLFDNTLVDAAHPKTNHRPATESLAPGLIGLSVKNSVFS